MNTPEASAFTFERETSHEKYGEQAAAWMASSRETVGDILLKNAALDGETIPVDVAAMAAANYRSALSWQAQGSQLAPSSGFEPIPQLGWPTDQPSPQLVSGITAAAEYLTLTAPPEALSSLEGFSTDTHSLADGLEGLIVIIFGTFMPWFTPPSTS